MNNDLIQVLEKMDAISTKLQDFIIWAEAAQSELFTVQQIIHQSFQNKEGQ